MAPSHSARHGISSAPRVWILSLALALPAFVPLIAHYIGFTRVGMIPTGFVQYDLPYYVANARELSDSGRLHLAYGNPFSFDYNTPRIYFQPLTLLMGIAHKIFNPDPGVLLAIFGVVSAVVCVRRQRKLGVSFSAQIVTRAPAPAMLETLRRMSC